MQILLLQTFSTCFGRHAPIIRSIKYWRPKHVEKVCSNKMCILLHHVGVLFNLVISFITLNHVSKHPVLLYQIFLSLQITYQLPVCVFNPASETFFDTVITGCPLRELHGRLREVLTPCSNIKGGEGGRLDIMVYGSGEKSQRNFLSCKL